MYRIREGWREPFPARLPCRHEVYYRHGYPPSPGLRVPGLRVPAGGHTPVPRGRAEAARRMAVRPPDPGSRAGLPLASPPPPQPPRQTGARGTGLVTGGHPQAPATGRSLRMAWLMARRMAAWAGKGSAGGWLRRRGPFLHLLELLEYFLRHLGQLLGLLGGCLCLRFRGPVRLLQGRVLGLDLRDGGLGLVGLKVHARRLRLGGRVCLLTRCRHARAGTQDRPSHRGYRCRAAKSFSGWPAPPGRVRSAAGSAGWRGRVSGASRPSTAATARTPAARPNAAP